MTEVWYVSHPYDDNPDKRIEEAFRIRKKFYEKRKDVVLLIPHLATAHLHKEVDRDKCMLDCKELLNRCDKMVHIIDTEDFSEGMKEELELAKERGIPIEKIEIDGVFE